MTAKPNIIDYGLVFDPLADREFTDLIVIHHTGNPEDDDLSAEEIHESHQNKGWAGIGYHYVIRKDGTIEQGRPIETIGAHAYGENWHTIGIHVCGNFELAEPTDEQIESLAVLVAWIADKYCLEINSDTVLAHRDLMPTDCCGTNLYNKLDTVRGKAIWYQLH